MQWEDSTRFQCHYLHWCNQQETLTPTKIFLAEWWKEGNKKKKSMKYHLKMRQILKCRLKNVLAGICEKAKIMAWKIYEIVKNIIC